MNFSLFGSRLARGYQEAGKRQSGAGCGGLRRQADRYGPCRMKEELRQRGKQANNQKITERRRRKKKHCLRAHKFVHKQERFVAFFSPHVYPPPSIPSSLLQQVFLSCSCFPASVFLFFCPIPPLPVFFFFFNAFLFPSLAHLSGTPCLGAIAANQTVYPSLISALPHGGFCPLKTMKVKLTAEPGM